MMQEKDNRSNEGDGENNLKSSNEVTVCSDEDVPDVDKRISELSDDDIRLLEFDFLQDAYDFYRERSEKHLNRTNRISEAKAITRTNCLARIRLYLDKDSSKWRVGMFEPDHNHELTPSTMVHLLPKYRGLSVADKEQVNSLHLYGVRTCHIMRLIMGQKGGHSDLGFCNKDLYNHIDKENRAKIEDGDAFTALCYLQAKLCSWHHHQNACENVKNPKFLEDFKMLLYANFTPERFEEEWLKVIEKHGLNNNKWVRKVYDLRRMWATICEGINSFIKRYVQSKNNLVDFLHNFERALNEYRHNELNSDYKSTYTQLVLTTTLEKYEVHACNVYTRNKFFDVRKEIEKVAALNVVDRSEISAIYNEDGDTSKKEVLRSGVVGAACNRLNKATHKNPHNFVKNIEAIHHLEDQMERQDGADLKIGDISRVVRDPTIVKTKGAPRKSKKMMKKRKCSYCKRPGHTVRTCSKFSTRDQLQTVEEEESSVESDGDSLGVTGTYNNESLNHSKGVQKCNKKAKHDGVVKLTRESVNDRDTVAIAGNEDFTQMHNDQRFSGMYQYRPSMIQHFAQVQFNSRVHVVPQYPHIPIQHPFHNSTGYHGMNTFASHSQNFTTVLNEVESKAGLSMKCFNPRDS
ncbi:Zinc finger, CCHC-type superfamily [Sesbania bispinosa]|nr:Zinc finger, CCHC-type superfamily [Sesbania bispinosa]